MKTSVRTDNMKSTSSPATATTIFLIAQNVDSLDLFVISQLVCPLLPNAIHQMMSKILRASLSWCIMTNSTLDTVKLPMFLSYRLKRLE